MCVRDLLPLINYLVTVDAPTRRPPGPFLGL